MDSDSQPYNEEDDLDQCLYYLRTLSNILRWSSDNMWAALAENTISTDPSYRALYRISEFSMSFLYLKQTLINSSRARWRYYTPRVFLTRLLASHFWDIRSRKFRTEPPDQPISSHSFGNSPSDSTKPICSDSGGPSARTCFNR